MKGANRYFRLGEEGGKVVGTRSILANMAVFWVNKEEGEKEDCVVRRQNCLIHRKLEKWAKFGQISGKIGLWMGKMEIWKGDCRNLFEILTYWKCGKTNWNVCSSRFFFVPSQPEIEISNR